MKLNLAFGPGDRPGYEWVDLAGCDPAAIPGVAPGEADEVSAADALEYLPLDKLEAALTHWCGLVGVGGTITVGAADLLEVAAAVADGKLPPAEANPLLHGPQRHPWEHKHATFTVRRLADALRARGLRVTRMKLDGLYAVVTATRD